MALASRTSTSLNSTSTVFSAAISFFRLSPSFAPTPATKTLAPAFAKASAVARPMPVVPPIRSTLLPEKS